MVWAHVRTELERLCSAAPRPRLSANPHHRAHTHIHMPVVRSWVCEMSDYIKSLGARQMISVGDVSRTEFVVMSTHTHPPPHALGLLADGWRGNVL